MNLLMRKTDGGTPRLRQPSLAMAAKPISWAFLAAITRRSSVAWRTCRTHQTFRLGEFVKKGGRKCYLASASMPQLETAFVTVIDTHTAGDPMQEGVLWTNLTRS